MFQKQLNGSTEQYFPRYFKCDLFIKTTYTIFHIHKYISGELQFNVASDQYVFANESLGLGEHYESQISNSTLATQTDSFNTISNFREYQLPSTANIASSSNDNSSSPVTYSNVILLPSLPDDPNHQLNSIEFIPDDPSSDTHFKYVVTSEADLLDSFQRNVIDAFGEQAADQMIASENESNATNDNNSSNIFISNDNRMEFESNQMSELLTENEVLMRTTNGQLYRQVQNIYSSELIPTNIPDEDALPDISYLEQNDYHPDDSSQQYQPNFVDTTTHSDHLLNQLIAEAEARLFDDNEDTKIMCKLPEFGENHRNRFPLQNHQNQNLMPLDREHERMLMEDAIQPLCKRHEKICRFK